MGNQYLILNNGEFVLQATATGAYYGQALGFGSAKWAYHDASDPGYGATSCAYYDCNTNLGAEEYSNDFFVFDLSSVSGPIFDATLSIGNLQADTGNYLSWDVTTPIPALEQSWKGYLGGFSLDPRALAIFNDLGSGILFGVTPFTPADDHSQITINLYPTAFQSIAAAEGGSWAIGGSVIPEPSSWVLLLVGFGAVAWARIRLRPAADRATGD